MKIKTKLYLGIGLLCFMIFFLAAVSTLYVSVLKNDTDHLLKANYNSLAYSRNLLDATEKLDSDPTAIQRLATNLKKQKQNVTEIGESAVTEKLEAIYLNLKKTPNDQELQASFRNVLVELMTVNMDAIVQKSEHAKETAQDAFVWISITGALCFLIAFVLLVNMPSNIANPIKELTASIKQVAQHNYNQRLHFQETSEFKELANSFNSMTEKLEEYANSKLDLILEEKKRVETLLNTIHNPVLGLDEHNKLVFINNEALEIAGLKRVDMKQLSLQEIVSTNDLIHDIIYKKEIGNQSLKIVVNNRECYFEKEVIPMEIIPTAELAPQSVGSVIVLKNVTSFKELDVAKTNFIATVSHELKTPIASIQMSAEVLKHHRTGDLTDEQKNLIDGIQEDSLRLLKITSELLNISQLETGNIKLYSQFVDPLPIVNYAINATRMQAEQKQIHILTEIEDELPKIYVDEEKTAWVLTNFITNAIRYSPINSEISVQVKKLPQGVKFIVQDHGKGIDQHYKERVFDRYFQIPGSHRAGTGLGLSISKEFIENQHGKIGVESELGLGSTFYFTIPVLNS
ncbi:HAMP domain-containing sensor histidine kinase [Sphingobacterium sp. HJSM2_6]|uniref:HAMP domain-containing sensor histidine kinase n=1 Tax=Sphingobacterium sp. HJSM2_6 TaxID=3366264 RepID=UPI003BC337F0